MRSADRYREEGKSHRGRTSSHPVYSYERRILGEHARPPGAPWRHRQQASFPQHHKRNDQPWSDYPSPNWRPSWAPFPRPRPPPSPRSFANEPYGQRSRSPPLWRQAHRGHHRGPYRYRRPDSPPVHWNREGEFHRAQFPEDRPSLSPQRSHRRSPERYWSHNGGQAGCSGEQEVRRYGRSEGAREVSGHGGRWNHEFSPTHHAPCSGPPRNRNRPQATECRLPAKRRNLDEGIRPKRACRETSVRPPTFGGRPLSLRDKSRLLKGRMIRAASQVAEPGETPQDSLQGDGGSHKHSSQKDLEDRRLTNEGNLHVSKSHGVRTQNVRRVAHKETSASNEESHSPRTSETLTIQVETRGGTHTYSSSPTPSDRQLSRDLVEVSRRRLSSRPRGNDGTSARRGTNKTTAEESKSLTLNERFTSLHEQQRSSPQQQQRSYPGLVIHRKVNSPKQKAATTTTTTKCAGSTQEVEEESSSSKKSSSSSSSARSPSTSRNSESIRRVTRANPVQQPSALHKDGQSFTNKYRHYTPAQSHASSRYSVRSRPFFRPLAYYRGRFFARW